MKRLLLIVILIGGCSAEPTKSIQENSTDSESDTKTDSETSSGEDDSATEVGTDSVNDSESESEDSETSSTSDEDTESETATGDSEDTEVIEGLCDYITCPEYPTVGDVPFKSVCSMSDFPGIMPDSVVHYSPGSGECSETTEGYECIYLEMEVECSMEEICVRGVQMSEPEFQQAWCLEIPE